MQMWVLAYFVIFFLPSAAYFSAPEYLLHLDLQEGIGKEQCVLLQQKILGFHPLFLQSISFFKSLESLTGLELGRQSCSNLHSANHKAYWVALSHSLPPLHMNVVRMTLCKAP